MSYIREKFTYLKGLADGLGINDETKEGKILLGMLELLDEVTYAIEELDDEVSEIDEMVEFLDDDLNVLEDEVYADLEDDEFDYYDMDEDDDYLMYQEPLFDNEFYCPSCGAFIELDEDDEELAIVCPECHQVIEIYSGDDDELDYEEDEFEDEDDEDEVEVTEV